MPHKCMRDTFFKGKYFKAGAVVTFDPDVTPSHHFVDLADLAPEPEVEAAPQPPRVIIAGDINKLPMGELRKIAEGLQIPLTGKEQKSDLVETIQKARQRQISQVESDQPGTADTVDDKDLFNKKD